MSEQIGHLMGLLNMMMPKFINTILRLKKTILSMLVSLEEKVREVTYCKVFHLGVSEQQIVH